MYKACVISFSILSQDRELSKLHIFLYLPKTIYIYLKTRISKILLHLWKIEIFKNSFIYLFRRTLLLRLLA